MAFDLFYIHIIFHQNNTYDLRFVTHKNAIQCIQSVCAESRKIKLCVGHTRPVTHV
jgi:hypothetical protein